MIPKLFSNKHRRVALFLGLLVCAFEVQYVEQESFADSTPQEPMQISPRFALLVGVQKYPNLEDHHQLAGCENDTRLLHQALTERYGYRDADIVTLTNEQATGARIRAAFADLTRRVRSLPTEAGPAQVVFLFSGHGSQLPDQEEGPDRDELDGLDETLVPFDATKQSGPEDIRDDEIYAWIEQICAGGKARIWCILDCCHSGTGARGTTRFRSLDRGGVLPPETEQPTNRPVTSKRLPQGAVLLAACRANEKEPEYQDGTEHYGLLTRFLTQVLNQQQNASQLSFDALRESIIVEYQRAGVTQAPTPQLEGARDSIVLGADSSLDRKPFWKAVADSKDRTSVTIAAGAMHGLAVGSLFELYERPDQIVEQPQSSETADHGASLAWLRIEQIDGIVAKARVFRWEANEQVFATLPREFKEGYCIERHHEHGDFVLKVRVVRALSAHQDGPPLTADNAAVQEGIRAALTSGGVRDQSESRWLRWTVGNEPCDFVVRLDGDYLAVFPAAGRNTMAERHSPTDTGVPKSLRGGWGPIDVRSKEAGAELVTIFRSINRARNLLRIAALSPGGAVDGPRVKLELVEVQGVFDEKGSFHSKAERPWPVTHDENGHESLVMRDGSVYTVRVTNLEPKEFGKPIHVTVLHMDADMGIHVLFPYEPGVPEEQRIAPGETRGSNGWFQCNAPQEKNSTHGLRYAIALATRDPNDFERLAQPSLRKARNASARHRILDQVLDEQLYFFRTRNSKSRQPTPVDGSWSAATIQWFVMP